jgi:hypothetical protein
MPRQFRKRAEFLGQVFRLAAATGIRGLTSFSDPMPRYDTSGNLYKPGHIGLIYQATNSRCPSGACDPPDPRNAQERRGPLGPRSAD